MKRPLALFLFILIAFGFTQQRLLTTAVKTGTVKITFINTVKGEHMVLNDSTYLNPFAESYRITKFKYYISNVSLDLKTGNVAETESYHLIDESKPESQSFSFDIKPGSYHTLNFLLGVDSLKNVSGAQTGALDPLNDMFWTWNSGYIMAKMEGRSPQSKLVNRKVEFHIGGFAGEDNVLKYLEFDLIKALEISEGKASEIIIEADLDKWWQQPNDLKISEHPVCSVPGPLAKMFADNYAKMFSIKQVINN